MAEDRTLENVDRFVIQTLYDSAGEVYVGIDNGRDCACCGICPVCAIAAVIGCPAVDGWSPTV